MHLLSTNTVAVFSATLIACAPRPNARPAVTGTDRASASAVEATLTVDASRPGNTISPLLYGQFAEFMFEGVKRGLNAELLRDRGFEQSPNAIGLPRDWERYPDDRNDDYGLNFRWDDSVAYPVRGDSQTGMREVRALRVDAGNSVIERHGFFQPRVAIRGGVAYHAALWLRTADYAGPVILALEQDASGGRVYAEETIPRVERGEWKRYEVVLRPPVSDNVARFVVAVPGQGRLWIDQASLMSADTAPGGVRRDVFDRIAALRPAFIRWPGGNVAQDYHWQWGVGPRDTRPTWVNLSWKNESEPGDIGTDEIIALARAAGAEPTLTVNIEGRGATAEEAAAWVEYCNGPATSRYGAMRAANGHLAPYGVKYWEIGNEIWGDWVRGHSDAASYARNYARYVAAMRRVDSTIKFIAVGDNDMAWNRTVLRAVGRDVDYLSIHHYFGFDAAQREPATLMARPLFYEQLYRTVDSVARAEVPGHRIALAINEYGLAVPERMQHGIDAALYGARMMLVFERTPNVGMSAVSDMLNGWPGGIIQAGRDRVFVSALYYVNSMFASRPGRVLLPTTRSGAGESAIDVVASRSADGRQIYLKIVSVDPSRAVDARIELLGAKIQRDAEVEVLASESAGFRNSFETPDAITPRKSAITAGQFFMVHLPARSVAVLTLSVVIPSE